LIISFFLPTSAFCPLPSAFPQPRSPKVAKNPYIAQTEDKDSKAQRQRWVKDLRAGKNPFTEAELKKLQN
ncbi:hypothetical protein, partial [Nostoc sp.]|uniref:hypothetical protein n=1 Tax=Nostoc sp. TaxID=1180 RepID=UPI002FF3DD01